MRSRKVLRLNYEEFNLLVGTDIMTDMIKNRLEVDFAGTADISEFIDDHISGKGMYYLKLLDIGYARIYFQCSRDMENIENILAKKTD